jgi:hypothetical protein
VTDLQCQATSAPAFTIVFAGAVVLVLVDSRAVSDAATPPTGGTGPSDGLEFNGTNAKPEVSEKGI